MPVPPRRQPVRVARGTYCSLNSNRASLLDGEVCYAEDLRAIFVAEERNGHIQLSAIRTTARPDPAPPLRLHGLLDATAAGNAPAAPHDGDVVVVLLDGTFAADWPGLAGDPAVAGHQLVYDAALPGWRDLGPTVQVPALPLDFAALPPLP